MSGGDPEELLHLLAIEAAVSESWRMAVDGMREAEYSDREIGAPLGITKQSVAKRWPRPRPAA